MHGPKKQKQKKANNVMTFQGTNQNPAKLLVIINLFSSPYANQPQWFRFRRAKRPHNRHGATASNVGTSKIQPGLWRLRSDTGANTEIWRDESLRRICEQPYPGPSINP